MFHRFSSLRVLALAAGMLSAASAAFAQQGAAGAVKITVTADGLNCGGPNSGSFDASDFSISVNTPTGSGGGGGGKTELGDLFIQKDADACSVPLFIVAARNHIIAKVVLTEIGKGNSPVLTITLENVQILSSTLSGANSSGDAGEKLDMLFGAITITDGFGHSTGRISRDAGAAVITPGQVQLAQSFRSCKRMPDAISGRRATPPYFSGLTSA